MILDLLDIYRSIRSAGYARFSSQAFRPFVVFSMVLAAVPCRAAESTEWNTRSVNTDPWVLIQSGRYGEPAIQATSVAAGRDALEVATLSVDCHQGRTVPNLRYSFIAERGLDKLEWWETVSGFALVEIDGAQFHFGRVSYNSGPHSYMLSEDNRENEFLNSLAGTMRDITLQVQVPNDGEVRQLPLSSKNYKELYGVLNRQCSLAS